MNRMMIHLQKRENRIKLGAVVVLCALVLCAIIYVVYDQNRRIPLSDYVTVEYAGVNGYGVVRPVVDTESLAARLIGEERDMERRTNLTALAESVTANVAQTNVRNGDEVDVVVSFNEELAREMKVYVKDMEYEARVRDLPEGRNISLFENVQVVFAGMSPEAYVWIQNDWDDEYLGNLQFSVDKPTGICTGDTVTVTCQTSQEELSLQGYGVDAVSASYKADKLSTYADTPEQINQEILATMIDTAGKTIVSQTEDTTFRMLYKATGDSSYLRMVNEEMAENVELQHCLFLKRTGQLEGTFNNSIVLLYGATVWNEEVETPVYFAFTYTDGYITVDGDYEIDHDKPEEKYQCSTDYATLYGQAVGIYEGVYTITEIAQPASAA